MLEIIFIAFDVSIIYSGIKYINKENVSYKKGNTMLLWRSYNLIFGFLLTFSATISIVAILFDLSYRLISSPLLIGFIALLFIPIFTLIDVLFGVKVSK